MTNLTIQTQALSANALFPRRRLHAGGKALNTPTKARPARRLRTGEAPAQESRGVVEVYRQIDTESLKDERRGGDAIRSKLQEAINKADDDEVIVAFLSYQEAQELEQVELNVIVDILDTYSDIIPTPLMPEVFKNVGDDEGPKAPSFGTYLNNVEEFLKTVRKRAPDAPVMGVIPPLGWEFTDHLMRLYAEYDVRGYCVNFNRRRITAARQVDMVKPMMRHIGRRTIADDVLFYGINMDPGQYDESLGLKPAADMASLGMGFDIVGGSHVSPSRPPEFFEQGDDAQEDEPVTFEFFDKETLGYKEVLLAELPQYFPANSGFNPEEIIQQAANSENHLRRLEKLVSAEQMALAARELQSQIPADSVLDHVASKQGVPPSTVEKFRSVRGAFDAGDSQSSLSNFA